MKPEKRKIRKHLSVKRSCPTDRKAFWGEVEKTVQSEKKMENSEAVRTVCKENQVVPAGSDVNNKVVLTELWIDRETLVCECGCRPPAFYFGMLKSCLGVLLMRATLLGFKR